MTENEARSLASAFLPAAGERIAIVAGSGALPLALHEGLVHAGHDPFLVAIAGEADDLLSRSAARTLDIEAVGKLAPLLLDAGVTHVVFAGGVSRRPVWHRIRMSFGFLRIVPRAIHALGAGDDALLRLLIQYMAGSGITVLGAHQIMPQLLTPDGVIGAVSPLKGDWKTIAAGWRAARAIGELDIGQAAIAFGSRAVALEGIEGTDGLLARTRDMRDHGRLNSTRRGVLVKCCKPGQDERTDLPSIGPQTIIDAHAAGLSGVAVEAGRSLILDLEGVRREADKLGLYVMGVREDML